jgi:hypothetical protein
MHNLSISEPPRLRDHTDYGCAICCEPDEDGFYLPGCDRCHEFDIERALTKECEMCEIMYENKVLEGWICVKHPRSYCEPGWCEGCEPDRQFTPGPEGYGFRLGSQ